MAVAAAANKKIIAKYEFIMRYLYKCTATYISACINMHTSLLINFTIIVHTVFCAASEASSCFLKRLQKLYKDISLHKFKQIFFLHTTCICVAHFNVCTLHCILLFFKLCLKNNIIEQKLLEISVIISYS